jgi:hypothetical protein
LVEDDMKSSLGWLVVAATLAAATSCSYADAPRESVGQTRAALVGALQPISLSAHGNDYTSVANPKVACGVGAPCVAVYLQDNRGLSFSQYSLVARRFDANGPVDVDTTLLAGVADAYPIRITAGSAGEYLITWGYGIVSAVRFDALTGAVSAPLNLSQSGGISDVQALAATDTGYVVVYNSGKIKASRLENGAVKDATGFELAPEGGASAKGAGAQVGVATTAGFVRFDAAQGKVLDAAPIVFDKYAATTDYLGAAGVSFDGNNYLLAYPNNGKMYAARIKASDGTLLDPPDDFNEKPGAHAIGLGSSHPSVWFDGTNFVALWTENKALEGARLNTAGTRVDSSFASYEFYLGSPGSNADAAFAAGYGLVAAYSTNGVYSKVQGLRLGATQGNAPTATTQQISFNGTYHDAFGVATNDADFLVAYRAADEDKLYVRVVDGLTGKASSHQRTLTDYPDSGYDNTDRVALAWSGKFYVAVWPQAKSTYFRLVHCDGTPDGGAPVLLGAGGGGRVACNDDRCVITWRKDDVISMKRLDARTGALLDSGAITINPSKTVYRGPEIATDSVPAANQRTFMVIWATAEGVYGQRLRSQGDLVSATTIQTVAGAEELQIASDGSEFLSSWRVGKQLFARAIDPLTGNLKGANVANLPFDIAEQSSLSFDGKSFLITWVNAGSAALTANRLDAAAANLDGVGTTIDPGQPYIVQSTTAGTSWGRSLIAQRAVDSPSFSLLVSGRAYDNELGTGVAARTFTCPGAGGDGGAAGSAGSSGSTAVGGSVNANAAGEGGSTEATGGADGHFGVGGAVAGESTAAGGAPSESGGSPTSTAGSISTSPAGDAAASGSPDSAGGTGTRAGAPSDEGASQAASHDTSGCGCRFGAAAPSTSFAPLLVLALAGVLSRRRARR